MMTKLNYVKFCSNKLKYLPHLSSYFSVLLYLLIRIVNFLKDAHPLNVSINVPSLFDKPNTQCYILL